MQTLATQVGIDGQRGDLEDANGGLVQLVAQAQGARDLAKGLVSDYHSELPSAVACFMDDFEAAIAHLRMPITHRRAIRTTNLLERLFVEERRRLKIIPNAFTGRCASIRDCQ